MGFVYSRNAAGRFADEVCRFYQALSADVLEFRESGSRVALFGDFNARLGEYVGDRSKNSNAPNFRAFLAAHEMQLLNKTFAFGESTYVKPMVNGNATSIIDFGVIDNLRGIESFCVLKTILGTTAHSSHRIIQTVFNTKAPRPQEDTAAIQGPPFETQFHRLSDSNATNDSTGFT